jgi:hypothetical protein
MDDDQDVGGAHAEALAGFLRGVDPKRRFSPSEMMITLPETVEPGSTFVIPFSPSEDAGAWKATFTWGGERHAQFQFELVPGQSLFQDPAQDGWVSWTGPGTLIAWADWENEGHGWAHSAASPLEDEAEGQSDEDVELTSDPLRWQEMALLCWTACSEEPEGFESGMWSERY